MNSGTAGMNAEAICHRQLRWKMRFAHEPRKIPNAVYNKSVICPIRDDAYL